MNNNYDSNSDTLNCMFIDNYFDEYKNLRFKDKDRLLPLIPSSYRKWFYSSLIEKTILTPCTIFSKLNTEQADDRFLFPAIRFETVTNKNNFSFVTIEYSVENHPIVDDLQILLQLCVPDLDLTDNDTLTEKDCLRFANALSLQDKFYTEYLFDVAVRLKLLKKIPSIYSNKAQVTPEFEKLYQKSKKDILDSIFDACLEITAFQVNAILSGNINPLPQKFFLELIKNPKPIDYFFEQIYSSLGINLDNFMSELESKNTTHLGFHDGFGDALISSTYLLGAVIDKYLLTPIGHYLKFIMPMYVLPFNFKDELSYLYETSRIDTELNPTVWSPCSNFFLTKLGLNYLHLHSTEENHVELPNSVPINFLIENIKYSIALHLATNAAESSLPMGKSYTVKAIIHLSKKFWFSFEIHQDATLACIHEQICDLLLLDPFADYSISIGESKSPFLTYVAANSRKKYKRANSISIKELNLEEGHTLTYFMPNTTTAILNIVPVMKIDLEITSIQGINPYTFYPFVSRKSKAFINWENEMNLKDFF